MWKYDSKDYTEGQNGITKADIDNNYQQFIDKANAGKFNRNGAIILAHELNEFTMQEAMDMYPKLAAAFSVRNYPSRPTYISRNADAIANFCFETSTLSPLVLL
jgi:hypothetical protein